MTDEIQKKLAELKPEKARSWNDILFSRVFSSVFEKELRYNRTAQAWMHYNGLNWEKDPGGLCAERLAKQFAAELLKYAARIADDETRSAFVTRVNGYGKFQNRQTLIRDARECAFVEQGQFDAETRLYNLKNGTLDLETFQLLPHNPDHFLEKISGVYYDPFARSALFDRFINEIMEGDQDKIRYLQRWHGYSLKGTAEEEKMLIELGKTTRNGKGTLNFVMLRMHGDYGISAEPETIQQRKRDSRAASGDIARLRAARFLNIAEPSRSMTIDAGLLKQLTGRDPITARHLHQSEFTFVPTFAPFMNCNALPFVDDTTLFDSGRLQVITFDRHFSDAEQDRRLKDKLTTKEALSAAFNWCIAGLKMYGEEGLNQPKSVSYAVEDYKKAADSIGRFISERLVVASPKHCLSAGEVFEKYQEWCADNGFATKSKSGFFDELKARKMLANTGTINGRTLHNVIKCYDYACDNS